MLGSRYVLVLKDPSGRRVALGLRTCGRYAIISAWPESGRKKF